MIKMKAPFFMVAALLVLDLVPLPVQGAGGMMVGGFSKPHDLLSMSEGEKSSYIIAATKAVDLMNSAQNGGEPVKFAKLLSVSTQIVAGVNYNLTIVVLRDKKPVVCNLMVTELEPWINHGTWSVRANKASDPCADLAGPHDSSKPTKLGGQEEVNEADQVYVKKAANWAVDHINGMSNAYFRQGLQKISNVKKQVVNGILYHFQLNMVPTACRNKKENFGKTLDECPASNDGKGQVCNVIMVDKRGEYSMENFDCKVDEAKSDIKRDVIGGGDHDYLPHGKENNLIGGGDHDYLPHGKENNLIGGGDHDYLPHGKENHLIGGGDHDYLPHGKENHLIGGGDHDYLPHGKVKNLLGSGIHDYLPHGLMNNLGRSRETVKSSLNSKLSAVQHMSILGGDDHDLLPHSSCVEYVEDFKMFKSRHNRLYADRTEERYRFNVFCTNMEKVKNLQRTEQGTAVYGATQFADLTEKEFRKQYLGFNPSLQQQKSKVMTQAEIPKGPIPDSWDWRDHGAVTPVKNQGSCGSCWAFSTTGNIEGQYAIKHKKLYSLSEQELVDCDKLDEGCNGGLPSSAYEAIMKLGGIETESDYKYEGDDEKCKFDKSEVAVQLSGAVNISQNEDEMAAWLYHNGPISIGINAFAMQFYFGGISHPWKIFCSPSGLDHGVLIVGYGKDGDEPYWIIKNSWGEGWGRKGYYYVYRGDGSCGLNRMCTSAKVD